MNFGNKYLVKGRRNAIAFNKDLYEDGEFQNIVENCQNDDIKLVVVGLNISFEDNVYLRQFEKIDKFLTVYGSNDYLGFNVLIDAVNYAQQLKRNNKKVLLYVIDLPEVIRVIERYTQKNFDNSYEHIQIFMKEIMSVAQAFDDGYSSTVLLRYNENMQDNELLKTEILRISYNIK